MLTLTSSDSALLVLEEASALPAASASTSFHALSVSSPSGGGACASRHAFSLRASRLHVSTYRRHVKLMTQHATRMSTAATPETTPGERAVVVAEFVAITKGAAVGIAVEGLEEEGAGVGAVVGPT